MESQPLKRQNDGVRDQVGGKHPGGFVFAGRQAARHVRQGDVGDAGIQHLHEAGQGHRDGDQPRIELGFPNRLVGQSAEWPRGGVVVCQSVSRAMLYLSLVDSCRYSTAR